jgi:branched-subunit amino acid transport protein
MNEFLLLLGMFLVTFGVRYPVLAFISRIRLPVIITTGLKYVPPAVLTAIIVPAVLLPEGDKIRFDLTNAPLFASITAILVSWRTKNLLLTILFGMAAFWIWRWVFAF